MTARRPIAGREERARRRQGVQEGEAWRWADWAGGGEDIVVLRRLDIDWRIVRSRTAQPSPAQPLGRRAGRPARPSTRKKRAASPKKTVQDRSGGGRRGSPVAQHPGKCASTRWRGETHFRFATPFPRLQRFFAGLREMRHDTHATSRRDSCKRNTFPRAGIRVCAIGGARVANVTRLARDMLIYTCPRTTARGGNENEISD